MAKTKIITELVVDGKVVANRKGRRILKDWSKLSQLKGIEICQHEITPA